MQTPYQGNIKHIFTKTLKYIFNNVSWYCTFAPATVAPDIRYLASNKCLAILTCLDLTHLLSLLSGKTEVEILILNENQVDQGFNCLAAS